VTILELMIETWSTPRTGTAHHWSLWADGKRIASGGAHADRESAEAEALQYCDERLKRRPDRVTRL
jgi:hypothetical protein